MIIQDNIREIIIGIIVIEYLLNGQTKENGWFLQAVCKHCSS